MAVHIKNSFIHVEETELVGGSRQRGRLNSAPPILTLVLDAPKPPEIPLKQPVLRDDELSLSEIFYTVFISPICERPPLILPAATTTLMVRNIPTRFTSVSFLRILDECGFRNCFDFFYLPMDFRTGKNMGYAFLNFTSTTYASAFCSLFNGRRLRMTTSTKVIEISPSRRQGLVENVALFKASDLLGSLSLPHFKPLVMIGGTLRPLSERVFAAIYQEPFGYFSNSS
jgi:hypothetical protein